MRKIDSRDFERFMRAMKKLAEEMEKLQEKEAQEKFICMVKYIQLYSGKKRLKMPYRRCLINTQ